MDLHGTDLLDRLYALAQWGIFRSLAELDWLRGVDDLGDVETFRRLLGVLR